MTKNQFEEIKGVDENGVEYWSARELVEVLEYSKYLNFLKVIEKAKESCKNSKQDINSHFADVGHMVQVGSGAKREVEDVFLSRYACYLIMQNADPRKVVVAKGQSYFAIQTKRQEDADTLIEDNKRVFLREEIKKHNTSLTKTAASAGVENYAIFQNAGYQGLYGGLISKDIHKKKKLKKSQKILDHMGSEELAANLFKATQTEAKIKREDIKGQSKANDAHFSVGRKVRNTIKKIGGTMPERLPSTDSISKAKTRLKKSDKKLK